jgi:hypothetical protein
VKLINENLKNEQSSKKGRLLVQKVEEDGIDWKIFFAEIKFLLYVVSWIFKIIVFFYICKLKKHKILKTLKPIKLIQLQRKIHFVLFNICSIDTMFIGTRSILHLRWEPEIRLYIVCNMVIFFLLTLDILEICV